MKNENGRVERVGCAVRRRDFRFQNLRSQMEEARVNGGVEREAAGGVWM